MTKTVSLQINPLLNMGHARGVQLGKLHLEKMLEIIGRGPHPDAPGQLVIWDFTGVESATFSYLKATVLSLLRYSGVTIDGEDSRLLGPPLNIFPVLFGLNTEVREELDILLASRKIFSLEVIQFNKHNSTDNISIGEIRGGEDKVVMETVRALSKAKSATASELQKLSKSPAGVTAWNNRLAYLYMLRLARRRKYERQLIYESLSSSIK